MVRAVALLLLVPLLAGCTDGDGPRTADATEAFDSADGAARERFEYTLFLGITGTEGPLDWSRYEAALNSTTGPGPSLARAFDQNVHNGAFGDGRLGSWLTTHFAYDEEERLVGGLYTQVLADGGRRAAFASFAGPYAGTTALPTMLNPSQPEAHPGLRSVAPSLEAIAAFQDRVGLLRAEADPSGETVLCALQTHTDGWRVTSEEAAAVALADDAFRAHMAALPGGELTYYYFPGLAVEADCPVELDAPDNFWAVSYTDLDAFLDPESPSPPLHTLRIDADNGTILERSTQPLVLRPPTFLTQTLTAMDPLVPTTHHHVHTLTIPVEENANRLELQAFRNTRPSQMLDDSTRLRDPVGRLVAQTDFESPLHRYRVDAPAAGEWVLEYRYRSLTPNGQHALDVHGAVSYH